LYLKNNKNKKSKKEEIKMRRKRQDFAKRLVTIFMVVGVIVAFSFLATLSGKQKNPLNQADMSKKVERFSFDFKNSKPQNNESACKCAGILTNFVDSSIHILDPATNTLFGPFLTGQLGERNSSLKSAVTPDGKTALIINPNSYSVFFVELSYRLNVSPILEGSINIGYDAKDIAITPDGKYALICCSSDESFIAVVDVENRFLISTFDLNSQYRVSDIEIAEDGQTVLAVDHSNKKIHVFLLDIDRDLTYSGSIILPFQPGPVSISPDGSTAIVVNSAEGDPGILKVESPGSVTCVEDNISLPKGYGVAAAFSKSGKKAYYISRNNGGIFFHELNINAAGIVSFSGTSGTNTIEAFNREHKMDWKGNDMITFGSTNQLAYTAVPISSTNSRISVTDLSTNLLIKNVIVKNILPTSITFGCISSTPDKPQIDQPPFGSFDTPADGSTVRSSIAVTGWALDDVGVESVKIYREQGGNLFYIGDAFFVEGARPDIAQAFPDYPNNAKAGWGYMMLTNFLPNDDGIYILHALATDSSGQQTTLGKKTITVDNASAVKPFGAIDRPKPGEVVSGTNYRILGWALTPQPNKIPEDGSTIKVYIDGSYIGNCIYNIYRPDITRLFPGYANSGGALAYFDFNPTDYSDGLHTLEWNVTDSAGNTDGIGSRYFSIDNSPLYGVILGMVVDLKGNPIEAVVSAAGRTVTASDSGWFSITDVLESDRLVINFTKDGYVPTCQITRVHQGISTFVGAVMAPESAAVEINGDTGGTVTSDSGSVTIDPNSLIDSNGVPYTGTARVSLTTFDPTDRTERWAFPGDFEGEATVGGIVPFASYGYMDITVRNNNNNELQLAEETCLPISIPVPASLQGSAPNTMPQWYFNFNLGRWQEAGTLTLNNSSNAYEGTICFLSYLNVDVLTTLSSTVTGTTVFGGIDIPYATITIEGPNWRRRGYSDQNGNFSIQVEPNSNVEIWAQRGIYNSKSSQFTTAGANQTYSYSNLSFLAMAYISIDLVWGESPWDLDDILSIPMPDGSRELIYQYNKETEYASLIADDANSYGPEIISVYHLNNGVYRFSVYHNEGNGTITDSPARVSMVIEGDRVYSATAPPGGTGKGDLWVVWDITVSGGVVTNVSLVNTISQSYNVHPNSM
jgi:hypothetical protein